MAEQQKDTIYVDIDDEITAIIDKVQGSTNKVVALVLPKRAATLQSIVNMKLLKRAADQGNKNLVLVTTESGLLPLAGAVGLHVAKTPNSRPEIPAGPLTATAETEEAVVDLSDDEPSAFTTDNAGDKTIGELAAATAPKAAAATPEGIETVELDNADDTVAPVAASAGKATKPKRDRKLAVPDFDRFRILLIAGGLALLLVVVFGYFAISVWPKATINVKTNASNVNTDVDFALSTDADSFSQSSSTVPAKQVSNQKTFTGSANATGQRNNGTKASGSIDMTLCTNNPGATSRIASGTAVSSGGKTYITQEGADFQYSGNCSGGFRFRSSNVSIAAQTGGASFNTGNNSSFSVAGRSDITASGSADGGTDDIQTVISQTDIDSAKNKVNVAADDVRADLEDDLKDQGLLAISATYKAGEPQTTTSAQAGDTASSVTVTQTITYTMLGADEDDVKALIDADIKRQIDDGKQSILSRGINQNAFKLTEATQTGARMNLQTTAEVGPDIDTTELATEAAGKKSGDIMSFVSANPDVTDVEVKLSPFWVKTAPKNVDKIKVTIAKPTKSANAN